jgi:hypothetical protein
MKIVLKPTSQNYMENVYHTDSLLVPQVGDYVIVWSTDLKPERSQLVVSRRIHDFDNDTVTLILNKPI